MELVLMRGEGRSFFLCDPVDRCMISSMCSFRSSPSLVPVPRRSKHVDGVSHGGPILALIDNILGRQLRRSVWLMVLAEVQSV
jgi:hypothetical protein